MMWLIARLLQAASAVDRTIRSDVADLPEGFSFCMRVRSGTPALTMKKSGDGLAVVRRSSEIRPTLAFEFKHVAHAFLVLSFQESTPRAFANDRLSIDGEFTNAMKVLRCLNRMNDTVDGCRVSGEIRLDGQDVYDKSLDVVPLRAQVGMVFQMTDDVLDLIATDYRYGAQLTSGKGPHRLKFGFYHLSSHLGDEYYYTHPWRPRINFSRFALVLEGLGGDAADRAVAAAPHTGLACSAVNAEAMLESP